MCHPRSRFSSSTPSSVSWGWQMLPHSCAWVDFPLRMFFVKNFLETFTTNFNLLKLSLCNDVKSSKVSLFTVSMWFRSRNKPVSLFNFSKFFFEITESEQPTASKALRCGKLLKISIGRNLIRLFSWGHKPVTVSSLLSASRVSSESIDVSPLMKQVLSLPKNHEKTRMSSQGMSAAASLVHENAISSVTITAETFLWI